MLVWRIGRGTTSAGQVRSLCILIIIGDDREILTATLIVFPSIT